MQGVFEETKLFERACRSIGSNGVVIEARMHRHRKRVHGAKPPVIHLLRNDCARRFTCSEDTPSPLHDRSDTETDVNIRFPGTSLPLRCLARSSGAFGLCSPSSSGCSFGNSLDPATGSPDDPCSRTVLLDDPSVSIFFSNASAGCPFTFFLTSSTSVAKPCASSVAAPEDNLPTGPLAPFSTIIFLPRCSVSL